jgi:hypothetical protein
VLIAEADDPVTVGSGCGLSGSPTTTASRGRARRTSTSTTWCRSPRPGTRARTWTSTQRQSYANDLGDYRSLAGVTDNVNQAKGDQDPAEWTPQYDTCRYLREFVAVKLRWRLSVDNAEKSAIQSLASGCANSTATVTRAI